MQLLSVHIYEIGSHPHKAVFFSPILLLFIWSCKMDKCTRRFFMWRSKLLLLIFFYFSSFFSRSPTFIQYCAYYTYRIQHSSILQKHNIIQSLNCYKFEHDKNNKLVVIACIISTYNNKSWKWRFHIILVYESDYI